MEMSDEVAEAVIGDERPQPPFGNDPRDQSDHSTHDSENHSGRQCLSLDSPTSRKPDQRARQNNRVETLSRDPQECEVPNQTSSQRATQRHDPFGRSIFHGLFFLAVGRFARRAFRHHRVHDLFRDVGLFGQRCARGFLALAD